MKSGTGSSSAKSIARQIANEPLEILKEAGEQIVGTKTIQPEENSPRPQTSDTQAGDQVKSRRLLGALEKEIEDIKKQDLFNDLQNRISQGEALPLENFTELSMEQKQVLKAQEEAYENQVAKEQGAGLNDVPAIHSKPSRRFGSGQKHEAEKQQTRVEKPIPPSG